jgi:hypothetical protein
MGSASSRQATGPEAVERLLRMPPEWLGIESADHRVPAVTLLPDGGDWVAVRSGVMLSIE